MGETSAKLKTVLSHTLLLLYTELVAKPVFLNVHDRIGKEQDWRRGVGLGVSEEKTGKENSLGLKSRVRFLKLEDMKGVGAAGTVFSCGWKF